MYVCICFTNFMLVVVVVVVVVVVLLFLVHVKGQDSPVKQILIKPR